MSDRKPIDGRSLHAPDSAWPKPFQRPKRTTPQFPESTRDTWDRLQDALDAAPDWSVPCRDDGHGNDWLADDPATQTRAAAACAGCPVLDACRAYASTARRKSGLFGVWGGHPFTSATTHQEPAATAARA